MTPPSNKQTRKAAETTARERAATLKAQAAREERRHKMLVRGGVAAVVAVIVGVVIAIPLMNKKDTPKGQIKDVTALGAASLPPWLAPADTDTAVAAASLTLLPNEVTTRHDHDHLDIFVDGKATPVAAYIGIKGGAASAGFAPLHTHATDGVIHIESVAGGRFTLSQVFAEWNVLLSPTQIGGLKVTADKTLTFYLNGKVLTTDPTKLELTKHQEITIVYGTKAENDKVKVPATYKWGDL